MSICNILDLGCFDKCQDVVISIITVETSVLNTRTGINCVYSQPNLGKLTPGVYCFTRSGQKYQFKVQDAASCAPLLGYGLLYNRYAVDDVRGIYPSGFRTATLDEFSDFDTFVGTPVQKAYGSNLVVNDDPEPRWNVDFDPIPTNIYGLNIYPAGGRRGDTGVYEAFGERSVVSLTPSTFGIGIFQNGSILNSSAVLEYGRSVRGVTDAEPESTIVTDADGNEYSWVEINGLYWMAQPLKTTSYNNGDPIATGLDNTAWSNTTDGAWAYPNGDQNLPI
jgi:hypothetical protein